MVKQPSERLNREIWSLTDSVKIFPTRDSIVASSKPPLAEQTDEGAEGRCYLGHAVLAKSRLSPLTNTTTTEANNTNLELNAIPHTEGPRTSYTITKDLTRGSRFRSKKYQKPLWSSPVSLG